MSSAARSSVTPSEPHGVEGQQREQGQGDQYRKQLLVPGDAGCELRGICSAGRDVDHR